MKSHAITLETGLLGESGSGASRRGSEHSRNPALDEAFAAARGRGRLWESWAIAAGVAGVFSAAPVAGCRCPRSPEPAPRSPATQPRTPA